MNPRCLRSGLLALCTTAATAQMEKRELFLYADVQFRAAAPAEGSFAPDLVLADLDGRPQALSAFTGRYLVLIKAGFT
jgi:hypothetical protein